ncbi:DUF1217 domain-containing protein [Yoonia sp. 2307UL14-13]|uniref:DUF1217 domain-containing protein n=1 Tax=Yoonia sp. 2307UL14-13 TaxID=3126506 RepID=UPI0030AC2A16
MTFQPIIPFGGYTGWRFLERTLDNQQQAFADSQPVARSTSYFAQNIGNVRTAEDLVNDRQLLSVALGAFGLDDDIDNRFFILQILKDGTIADDALANRLTDNRYADFSRAFGFGDRAAPRTGLSQFPEEIVSRYEARQFERAVGEQNNDLRLAMNVESGLSDILDRSNSQDARWFSVMGNPPLRSVFQTALGLPQSIASIDLDKQLSIFKDRAQSVFGTDQINAISQPEQREKLVRLFLVRSEAANTASVTAGATALTLLQSTPRLTPQLA